MLVEATKGTWLLGIGSGTICTLRHLRIVHLIISAEHNTLYQANFQSAQNVFLGFQQSETAYWQGSGQATIAPDPWGPVALSSDPDFSWCAGGDAQVRRTLPYCVAAAILTRTLNSVGWVYISVSARLLH